jgi:hypothetical protein
MQPAMQHVTEAAVLTWIKDRLAVDVPALFAYLAFALGAEARCRRHSW